MLFLINDSEAKGNSREFNRSTFHSYYPYHLTSHPKKGRYSWSKHCLRRICIAVPEIKVEWTHEGRNLFSIWSQPQLWDIVLTNFLYIKWKHILSTMLTSALHQSLSFTSYEVRIRRTLNLTTEGNNQNQNRQLQWWARGFFFWICASIWEWLTGMLCIKIISLQKLLIKLIWSIPLSNVQLFPEVPNHILFQ